LPGLAECLGNLARRAIEAHGALPQDADPQLRNWMGKLAAQCDAPTPTCC
jgi:cyclic beta-1,2-glucan synthetase